MLLPTHTERTRVAVGGPGLAYDPFQPKAVVGAEAAAGIPVWWLIDVNEAVIGGDNP